MIKTSSKNAAKTSWDFDQTPETAAITTVNVLNKTHPIKVVVHYEGDHSWAFMCGTTNDVNDGRVISMKEAVDLDPSISQVANLKPGWKAVRTSSNDSWQYTELDDLTK